MSATHHSAPGPTGRFAPSPTGDLHLGSLRTALAAWLFARSTGASFLLRIEDLDPDRSVAHFEESQLRDLTALGLDWDAEPVRQSERLDLYRSYIQQLESDGLTYPCFCTRAEIREAASAPHGPFPEGAYPGTCAQLSTIDANARVDRGEAHCIRLRCDAQSVAFEDGMLGTIETVVDDFVVVRKDGVPAYNVAVIVDDCEQGIQQVVRGDDLAETTPRQLLLARVLGLTPPSYLHLPLVLGGDGSRLAKRHGAVTLQDWCEANSATHDYCRRFLAATLGFPSEHAAASPAELAKFFDSKRIPGTPYTLPKHASFTE